MQEIADHLAAVGSHDWTAIRSRYGEVPDTTWWRWVRQVKADAADQERLAAAKRDLIERALSTSEADKLLSIARNLPASVSPDFIAKNGSEGHQSLDILAHFNELYADAMLLREYAMDSDGRVKAPVFFAQAINLRDSLLNTAMKAAQMVWDLRRMQQFFDIIVEEIGNESPTTKLAILDRLKKLNAKWGYNFDARV
jgi:hypothetical protein